MENHSAEARSNSPFEAAIYQSGAHAPDFSSAIMHDPRAVIEAVIKGDEPFRHPDDTEIPPREMPPHCPSDDKPKVEMPPSDTGKVDKDILFDLSANCPFDSKRSL